MKTSRLRDSSVATLGLALLMSTVTGSLANPEHPRLDAACAAFDVHVLTLIEDHGRFGDTAPEALSEAASQMLAARLACREGDATRALDTYGRIALGAAPPPSLGLSVVESLARR